MTGNHASQAKHAAKHPHCRRKRSFRYALSDDKEAIRTIVCTRNACKEDQLIANVNVSADVDVETGERIVWKSGSVVCSWQQRPTRFW